MTRNLRIVELAENYVKSNIQEIQVNHGWTDRQYMLDMIHYTGWYFGAEWCAASAILVWKKAYEDDLEITKKLKHLCSLNCQQMGRNFHNDAKWPTSTKTPILGAIVIWGDGESETKGHCGIIRWIAKDGKSFIACEGNTSSFDKPDIRTGWTYAEHLHTTNKPHSQTGLNFIRYIYPIENY